MDLTVETIYVGSALWHYCRSPESWDKFVEEQLSLILPVEELEELIALESARTEPLELIEGYRFENNVTTEIDYD